MGESTQAPPTPTKNVEKNGVVRWYLIAYNTLSALGWAYILALTLFHVSGLDDSVFHNNTSIPSRASSAISKLFSILKTPGYGNATSLESRLPVLLRPFYRRASTTFVCAGRVTTFVQSFAVLEILHVLFGWVRSPLSTTVAQVASRLFLVWGVVTQFDTVQANPLFASMIFAWSMTEVIRYAFYTGNLLGLVPHTLVYLRYTTFYVLYPLGASSEAFLIYATLPPSWSSWKIMDYGRAALFAIWWPGLYVMYNHMTFQRRKALGTTNSIGNGTQKRTKRVKTN